MRSIDFDKRFSFLQYYDFTSLNLKDFLCVYQFELRKERIIFLLIPTKVFLFSMFFFLCFNYYMYPSNCFCFLLQYLSLKFFFSFVDPNCLMLVSFSSRLVSKMKQHENDSLRCYSIATLLFLLLDVQTSLSLLGR